MNEKFAFKEKKTAKFDQPRNPSFRVVLHDNAYSFFAKKCRRV
jgi:hypothetical protein